MLQFSLRGGSASTIAVGLAVGGDGVADGAGVGAIDVGLGVNVGVAGGVTRSSRFCPGRITDALFSPLQFNKSASGTSYKPAIHESVSPLWTTW